MEKVIRPFQTLSVTPPRRSVDASGGSGSGPARITVGGGIVALDQLVVTITSTAIGGSPVQVSYTVGGGDTLATVTAGIVAAINGNGNLSAAGVTAAVSASRPVDFTVSQPAGMVPAATVSVSASGSLSVSLTGETIASKPGARGSIKSFSASQSEEITFYTTKYPREMGFGESLQADFQNLRDNIHRAVGTRFNLR